MYLFIGPVACLVVKSIYRYHMLTCIFLTYFRC